MLFPSLTALTLSTKYSDIQLAIQALKKQPGVSDAKKEFYTVDEEKVVWSGHGKGAYLAYHLKLCMVIEEYGLLNIIQRTLSEVELKVEFVMVVVAASVHLGGNRMRISNIDPMLARVPLKMTYLNQDD